MRGQHGHRRIDLLGQADRSGDGQDRSDTAMGDRPGPLRQFVRRPRPAQHRAVGVHSHRPLQPPADPSRLPGQHLAATLAIGPPAAPACTTS